MPMKLFGHPASRCLNHCATPSWSLQQASLSSSALRTFDQAEVFLCSHCKRLTCPPLTALLHTSRSSQGHPLSCSHFSSSSLLLKAAPSQSHVIQASPRTLASVSTAMRSSEKRVIAQLIFFFCLQFCHRQGLAASESKVQPASLLRLQHFYVTYAA
jgi:hypothetical protein